MICKICGKTTDPDENALYRRLVDRGATDSMCLECMAKYFSCTPERLKEKIAHFRAMGCSFFTSSSR